MDEFGIGADLRFTMWDWSADVTRYGRRSACQWRSRSVWRTFAPFSTRREMDEHFAGAQLTRNLRYWRVSSAFEPEFPRLRHLGGLALRPAPAPFPGIPAAAGNGKQRQVRHPRWAAARLPERPDRVGRAGVERAAFFFSAIAPGYGGRRARFPRAGAKFLRTSGTAKPRARQLLRSGAGLHGGQTEPQVRAELERARRRQNKSSGCCRTRCMRATGRTALFSSSAWTRDARQADPRSMSIRCTCRVSFGTSILSTSGCGAGQETRRQTRSRSARSAGGVGRGPQRAARTFGLCRALAIEERLRTSLQPIR